MKKPKAKARKHSEEWYCVKGKSFAHVTFWAYEAKAALDDFKRSYPENKWKIIRVKVTEIKPKS